MLLIEVDGCWLLYTGDFRRHGPQGSTREPTAAPSARYRCMPSSPGRPRTSTTR
jgi:mRNA degradation ribonuclease J1/J2